MAKNYIVPDDVFDSLEWNDTTIQDLASLLLGSQIVGLEPITDGTANTGAVIYIERRSGELLAVELFWDYEELIMATATVPKR